jgi:glycine reductase complex component B subunit alpha and beta
MRLELAEYPVTAIRPGRKFSYQSGVLEIDAPALSDIVLRDARIRDVSLSVVRPGDNVRITGIRDVVEPRVKSVATVRFSPESSGRWNLWAKDEPTVCPEWR